MVSGREAAAQSTDAPDSFASLEESPVDEVRTTQARAICGELQFRPEILPRDATGAGQGPYRPCALIWRGLTH